MTIQVMIKNVYGVEKVYPVCDRAKVFASIAGMTTLTTGVIQGIKRLGYTVEVVSASPKTL